MVDYKELAYDRINQLEEMLKTCRLVPTTFTYVKAFEVVQELYFQKQYKKAIAICDILINKDE